MERSPADGKDHHQVHGTRGPVAVEVIDGGAEQQRGHSQEARQQPNGTQGGQHGAPRAQPAAGQRVHDGQVAVKAQAGQAENTGVHVDQNHVAADLAQSHTKGPVVAQRRVHSPQR
uniref:Uncharacterized protein n=1 Tax=Acanthochromis polyacanthus TaxID=80966 RepID=A0A3Q1GFN0_9TELE